MDGKIFGEAFDFLYKAFFVLILVVVCLVGYNAYKYFQNSSSQNEAITEIDRAIEQAQKLIDAEQTRLGGKVIVATPPEYRGTEKLDVSIKLQYLLWKLEIAIMLQRIDSGGARPGSIGELPPGMTFGASAQ